MPQAVELSIISLQLLLQIGDDWEIGDDDWEIGDDDWEIGDDWDGPRRCEGCGYSSKSAMLCRSATA